MKAHSSPNSSGRPKRLAGIAAIESASTSASVRPLFRAANARPERSLSVSKRPGRMLLMVTLRSIGLARQARDEAGQARARAVRQAQLRDRGFHRARGDVDDAAEAALAHAVDHGFDQHDRRDHVGVAGAGPGLLVPLAKIAGRWAAGIVDQDVHVGTGGQRRATALGGGDVADHGLDHGAGLARDLIGGGIEGELGARGDRDRDAVPGERQGAAAAEPLAGRAHQRFLAGNSQIHQVPPRVDELRIGSEPS